LLFQQVKINQTLPGGLLQPPPIPQQVWNGIALDFITNLPVSPEYSNIKLIVDRLLKYVLEYMTLNERGGVNCLREVFENFFRFNKILCQEFKQ